MFHLRFILHRVKFTFFLEQLMRFDKPILSGDTMHTIEIHGNTTIHSPAPSCCPCPPHSPTPTVFSAPVTLPFPESHVHGTMQAGAVESDFSICCSKDLWPILFSTVAPVCLIVWTRWILQLQDIWGGKPVIFEMQFAKSKQQKWRASLLVHLTSGSTSGCDTSLISRQPLRSMVAGGEAFRFCFECMTSSGDRPRALLTIALCCFQLSLVVLMRKRS